MKKLFVIVSIAISFVFSGCYIDYSEYFSASQEAEQVKLIEVYYIEDYMDETSTDDLSNPIHTVEQSSYVDFISDLETLYFKDGVIIFPLMAQDPNIYHHGYAVKILYLDSSYDLISQGFRSYSTNDDTTHRYGQCDQNAFLSIIQKYCNIEI